MAENYHLAQNREKSYCYDGCVYEQGYYFDNKKIMDIREKRASGV